jgi:nitrite reductase/ring-hydroxylating ferredoxin subunit
MSLRLAKRLGAAAAPLDPVSDGVQAAVQTAVDAAQPVADLLDGRWLGAPLHAALTDVPVGALSAAVALDLLGREEADAALTVGIVGALPAAATGLADWRYLRGEEKRIGTVHALMNIAGLAFHVGSLLARRRGNRRAGRGLLLAGYALNGTAAHIGGLLSFGLGVRVNRTAFEDEPERWTDVAAADLEPDELRGVDLDGTRIVLARSGRSTCAIAATCSHLGGPLDEGTREGDTVVCPWHASRFDLCSGEVLSSPAVFPQPRYEARVRQGRIELRAAAD